MKDVVVVVAAVMHFGNEFDYRTVHWIEYVNCRGVLKIGNFWFDRDEKNRKNGKNEKNGLNRRVRDCGIGFVDLELEHENDVVVVVPEN